MNEDNIVINAAQTVDGIETLISRSIAMDVDLGCSTMHILYYLVCIEEQGMSQSPPLTDPFYTLSVSQLMLLKEVFALRDARAGILGEGAHALCVLEKGRGYINVCD